jgi:hypothetical protein
MGKPLGHVVGPKAPERFRVRGGDDIPHAGQGQASGLGTECCSVHVDVREAMAEGFAYFSGCDRNGQADRPRPAATQVRSGPACTSNGPGLSSCFRPTGGSRREATSPRYRQTPCDVRCRPAGRRPGRSWAPCTRGRGRLDRLSRPRVSSRLCNPPAGDPRCFDIALGAITITEPRWTVLPGANRWSGADFHLFALRGPRGEADPGRFRVSAGDDRWESISTSKDENRTGSLNE